MNDFIQCRRKGTKVYASNALCKYFEDDTNNVSIPVRYQKGINSIFLLIKYFSIVSVFDYKIELNPNQERSVYKATTDIIFHRSKRIHLR